MIEFDIGMLYIQFLFKGTRSVEENLVLSFVLKMVWHEHY